MNKAKKLYRRVLCAVLLFVFFLTAPLLSLPADAATVPDTLKVYAQYWGDPDSAVLLAEFTRDELNALSYGEYGYEGYYCNVTNWNTVMRIHARGVKLAEFLSECVHVDLNSVRQLDFHTTDVEADARFVSKGRWELLDSPRYYYPHLMENSHIDDELNQRVVDNEEAAREGEVQVPTLLAVVQYSTKNPNDKLTGEMTVDNTFRLCAGQPDLTTKTSFESARWVDEIYVVLAGSPPEEPTNPEPPPEEPSSEDPSTEPTKAGSEDQHGPAPDTPTEPTTAATQPTPDAPTARPTTQPSSYYHYRPSGRRTTANPGNQLRPSDYTPTAPAAAAPGTGGTTAFQSERMDQLIVDGYDSLIQWKQDSPDNVTPLQKPVVTTDGVRNAALLFLGSFAAGAILMYTWFKKER